MLDSTVVVAIATVVIAVLTWKYTSWTRRLVEGNPTAAESPDCSPYFTLFRMEQLEDVHRLSNRRNDGFRQARDLSFEADPDFHISPNRKLSR